MPATFLPQVVATRLRKRPERRVARASILRSDATVRLVGDRLEGQACSAAAKRADSLLRARSSPADQRFPRLGRTWPNAYNRIQKFGTSVNSRRTSEPATTMIGSPLCDRCSSVVARIAEEVLRHLTILPGGKVRGVKWLRIVRNRLDFIRVEPFCKEVGDRDGEASAQSREFLLVEPDWCVRAGTYQTKHSCKTMLLLLGNEARGS